MSGIAGWIATQPGSCTENVLKKIIDSLRGIDSVASEPWVSQDAVLAWHCSVKCNPGEVHQPISLWTPRGYVVLAFNGELHNVEYIQGKLDRRGIKNEESAVPELILTAYLEWGESVAELLDGSFSFVLLDERYEKLLLCRDRLGIEPLYYYNSGNGVLFGSEVNFLLQNPIVGKTIDPEGLRNFLSPFRVSGRSLWKGVYEVIPGTVLTFQGGHVRSRTYWELPKEYLEVDSAAACEETRQLVKESVVGHLIGNGTNGILLSGGLDSSIVAAIASEILANKKMPLNTYSVEFSKTGPSSNKFEEARWMAEDTPYAHLMSQSINSRHRDIELDFDALADPHVRRRVIRARGSVTTLQQMDVSLYLLAEEICGEVDVALTGSCADILFGDNSSLACPDQLDRLKNVDVMVGSVGDAYHWLNREMLQEIRLNEFLRDQHASIFDGRENFAASDSERQMRAVLRCYIVNVLPVAIEREISVSKALGIKIRQPYLNWRLIEYVYKIPGVIRSPDGKKKGLLREVGKEVLPSSILHRNKTGYPAAFADSYIDMIKNQAREIACQRNDRVFELVDRSWFLNAIDTNHVGSLERAIDVYHLLDIYTPQIAV